MAVRKIEDGPFILKTVTGGRNVKPGHVRLLVVDDLAKRSDARWTVMHMRDYRLLNVVLVRRDKCCERTTTSQDSG